MDDAAAADPVCKEAEAEEVQHDDAVAAEAEDDAEDAGAASAANDDEEDEADDDEDDEMDVQVDEVTACVSSLVIAEDCSGTAQKPHPMCDSHRMQCAILHAYGGNLGMWTNIFKEYESVRSPAPIEKRKIFTTSAPVRGCR